MTQEERLQRKQIYKENFNYRKLSNLWEELDEAGEREEYDILEDVLDEYRKQEAEEEAEAEQMRIEMEKIEEGYDRYLNEEISRQDDYLAGRNRVYYED